MANKYDHLIGKRVRLVPNDEHEGRILPMTGTYEGVQLASGFPCHTLSYIRDGQKFNAGGMNTNACTVEEVE